MDEGISSSQQKGSQDKQVIQAVQNASASAGDTIISNKSAVAGILENEKVSETASSEEKAR